MGQKNEKVEAGAAPEKVKIEEVKRIEHSNIYAALSAFQGELKPMEKTGVVKYDTNKGGKVDFKYTPLGEIMKTIYPMLAKHGLSVRHEVSKDDAKNPVVEAILTHATYKRTHGLMTTTTQPDGTQKIEQATADFVEGELRSGPVKISYGSDMKDTGAAMTYARRYSLTMLLGIASEDDLDAELLEQSAKNAIQTVFDRFAAGIEKAKTIEEVDKAMEVVKKDMEKLKGGKAPSLGLAVEQYEELLKLGEARKGALE